MLKSCESPESRKRNGITQPVVECCQCTAVLPVCQKWLPKGLAIKEMTTKNRTLSCGPVWHLVVRERSSHTRSAYDISRHNPVVVRTHLEMRVVPKIYTSQERAIFRWLDTAPSNYICRRTDVRGKIDIDESSAVTAVLTIALSSCSAVALGQPLPFWRWYLSLFTHSFQYRLIAPSFRPRCRAIVRFVQPAFFDPI